MELELQPIAVCDAKHGALEGLIKSLQESHSRAAEKREDDLARIYTKLEEFGQRPTYVQQWLTSICFGIIGAETMWIIHILIGGK